MFVGGYGGGFVGLFVDEMVFCWWVLNYFFYFVGNSYVVIVNGGFYDG